MLNDRLKCNKICGIFEEMMMTMNPTLMNSPCSCYLCTNHVGVHKRMFLVRNPALFGWELRLRSDTQFLARDPINVIQCLRGEGRQWTSSRGPIVLNYDRHRQLLQGLSWVLPFDSMIMMVFLFKVLISIIRNFQQL